MELRKLKSFSTEPIIKNVTCPICLHNGDIYEDKIDNYYIFCENCKQQFELGFQIHSRD